MFARPVRQVAILANSKHFTYMAVEPVSVFAINCLSQIFNLHRHPLIFQSAKTAKEHTMKKTPYFSCYLMSSSNFRSKQCAATSLKPSPVSDFAWCQKLNSVKGMCFTVDFKVFLTSYSSLSSKSFETTLWKVKRLISVSLKRNCKSVSPGLLVFLSDHSGLSTLYSRGYFSMKSPCSKDKV